MDKQLTLDGTPRELKVDVLVDGWDKYREQAKKDQAGCYQCWTGEYDSDTDTITINLDVLLECCFGGYDYRDWSAGQCDVFIWKLTKTITHEYIHHILNELVSEKACSQLDKITEKITEISDKIEEKGETNHE